MDFSQPFGGLMPGARGAVLDVLLRTSTPLTGRRVHALTAGHSLSAVQQALRDLDRIGLITTETVGRAGVHRINDAHISIPALRSLSNPLGLLTQVVAETTGGVEAVILFGSLARGEAHADSDIDLAILAAGWDGRADLQQAIAERLGNDCDVLVFSPDEFLTLAARAEPVVVEILRDGIPLVGALPRSPRLAS